MGIRKNKPCLLLDCLPIVLISAFCMSSSFLLTALKLLLFCIYLFIAENAVMSRMEINQK